MDDVLIEFLGGYTEFMNKKLNSSYSLEDIKDYDLTKLFGYSKQNMLDSFDEYYEIEQHTVIPDAVKCVRSLHEQGNELYIVTLRPLHQRELIKNMITINYGDVFTDFMVNCTNKGLACKALGIQAFVDDAVHNVESVSKQGISTYLRDRPWNKRLQTHSIRFDSYSDLEYILSEESYEQYLKESLK